MKFFQNVPFVSGSIEQIKQVKQDLTSTDLSLIVEHFLYRRVCNFTLPASDKSLPLILGSMGRAASNSFAKASKDIQELFYNHGFFYSKETSKIIGGDQKILRDQMIGCSDMPDRTAYLENPSNVHSPIPVAQRYLDKHRHFEKALFAIAVCNTFHAEPILGVIQKNNPDIPFLKINRATEIFIKQNYPYEKVGILATNGTIKFGVYNCLNPICPDPESDIQGKIMMAIYSIKNGFINQSHLQTTEQKKELLEKLKSYASIKRFAEILTPEDIKTPKEWFLEGVNYLREKGASVIIMGCTEVPEALCQNDTDVILVDTVKILALAHILVAHDPGLAHHMNLYRFTTKWRLNEVLQKMDHIIEKGLLLSQYPAQLISYLSGSQTDKALESPALICRSSTPELPVNHYASFTLDEVSNDSKPQKDSLESSPLLRSKEEIEFEEVVGLNDNDNDFMAPHQANMVFSSRFNSFDQNVVSLNFTEKEMKRRNSTSMASEVEADSTVNLQELMKRYNYSSEDVKEAFELLAKLREQNPQQKPKPYLQITKSFSI